MHRLADAMITVKEKVRFCIECGNVSEEGAAAFAPTTAATAR